MDYGKKSKLSFTVWACPQVATAVVEPYNTVLCIHSLLENTDITVMYDNEGLYEALPGCLIRCHHWRHGRSFPFKAIKGAQKFFLIDAIDASTSSIQAPWFDHHA